MFLAESIERGIQFVINPVLFSFASSFIGVAVLFFSPIGFYRQFAIIYILLMCLGIFFGVILGPFIFIFLKFRNYYFHSAAFILVSAVAYIAFIIPIEDLKINSDISQLCTADEVKYRTVDGRCNSLTNPEVPQSYFFPNILSNELCKETCHVVRFRVHFAVPPKNKLKIGVKQVQT